ncbi:hypothetical protein Z517_11743 [Fonsecaea pedrosoi CBS 271.37]|uniref:Uncharacterized protein n=1 Tax=Fonsecaea pedrosoi CBS 271.37 TaxID=1442368 RepID=A0A0D2EKN1_9EURO|nr:uncharacterized protein Z517_11743 [Fonsecaea pedrosoi CBS 271.37]KIW74972.1 hypothetical protein Z517_11743 [Fonsecaea pedrosoi CBS 271.37]
MPTEIIAQHLAPYLPTAVERYQIMAEERRAILVNEVNKMFDAGSRLSRSIQMWLSKPSCWEQRVPKQGAGDTAVVAHLKQIGLPTLAKAHRDLQHAVINHLCGRVLLGIHVQGPIIRNNAVTANVCPPQHGLMLGHSLNLGFLLPPRHQADEAFGAGLENPVDYQEIFGEGMRVGVHQLLID